MNKQYHLPPPPHCPLKTRPRFRSLAAFDPSARHVALLERYSAKLVVVGAAGRQCVFDGRWGRMGLSVEGIEAY